MIFRDLEKKDIEKVLLLCEEHFHAVKMSERGYNYKKSSARATLESYVLSADIKVYVAERNDEFEGIIAFFVHNSPFDEEYLEAGELLWYAKSSKTAIELFHKIEKVLPARANLRIGIPVENKVKKFLERKGFKMTEIIMSKIKTGEGK